MKSILIIEDDEILNAGLCYNLNLEGYETVPAYNIDSAKTIFPEQEWALCILDVNLPDGDGIDYGKVIRKQSRVPIIFLTARDMDEDMIRGFSAGADDYITKPFNVKILMQRVHAILRRCQEAEESIYRCGNLEIDFKNYIVKKNGKALTLTPTEYKLLFQLCKNPGNVLTRQILLEELWDKNENYVDEHTLTINISRLRAKIADEKYVYIKTIYGLGYQWIGEKYE
ncbi:response regulator transcription factor [Anaerocolumna sp.]|uniref:response regulator transcription factor n=1 Tax=Anaerocolumna sp. TaxID=2041569 RepID=UPI0028A91F7E|nr:response regulator transcription factor [Anaerocolumna sp.]